MAGLPPGAVLELARPALASDAPLVESADLRIEDVRFGLSATHYRFAQWIGDRRVFGAGLILSVSPGGEIVRHHVSLARPRTDASDRDDLLLDLRRSRSELASAPILQRTRAYRNRDGRARPVERFRVEVAPFRETVFEVDAVTGEILFEIPTWATVTGRVFPSNPVTRLNDPYLRDDGDAAAAVPEEAYAEVDLLSLGESGELTGPNVRIVDIDSPFTSRARIEEGLLFLRDRDEFEEVNVYHHIDQSQRYLQSLGYAGDRQIVPEGLRVDVHANRGADNSFYSLTGAGPTILLGDGGVDDAEDPDIVLHEYGHAIHDSLSPGALFAGSDSEARAISEGFGDYWAFSSEFEPSIASGRDPFCVGDWDARCSGPSCAYPADADCLRRVDNDLTRSDFIRSNSAGTEHANGRIWSRFTRDLFLNNVARFGLEEGRRRTDTVVLEGMQGLPFSPGFDLVVEKMIDADRELYDSTGLEAICAASRARGFGVPLACRYDLRGETIVVPGGDPILINGGTIERQLVVSSDAVISKVMVGIDLADDAPEDLGISLITPDGVETLLKEPGTTLPRSVTFGRDRLPDEPLDSLEGRPNPGLWTLRFVLGPGSAPVRVESWRLIVELDSSEKIDVRGFSPGARIIPAVAHTPGAEGTFFVSDLAISNRGGDQELILIYTPSGEDGTTRFSAIRLSVPGGESMVLNDVVRTVFDATGSGSLEIRGAGPQISLSSRTYNQAPAGTFGQTIPSVRDSARFGERLLLSQIRRSKQYRTNVGLVDLSGSGGEAVVRVRDREGEIVGESIVSLEPFTRRQIPLAEIVEVAELESAWADVTVTGPDDVVGAYVSVVDNRTGDSVFVPGEAIRTVESALAIPAAARVPGANGTRWRTDLWIVNGSAMTEEVEISFHRSDGAVISSTIMLAPERARLLSDVVGEWFQTQGSGWIELDPSRLTVSSRTWNDDVGGSYGQYIGAITLEQAAVAGNHRVVPKVSMTEEFRSNVGVTEVGGGYAALTIAVKDGAGTLQCSRAIELEPREHRQWSVLELGCETLGGGRVEITHKSGAGRIAGYVSIVDQRTGDPSYIPAD